MPTERRVTPVETRLEILRVLGGPHGVRLNRIKIAMYAQGRVPPRRARRVVFRLFGAQSGSQFARCQNPMIAKTAISTGQARFGVRCSFGRGNPAGL